MNKTAKTIITYGVIIIIIPLIIFLGIVLFNNKNYNIISIAIAIFSIIPFIIYYEHKESKIREIVCIAVMVALCVAGRTVFILLPGFKPVAAIVIITGIFFNAPAGFLTGALAAFLSNIIFGQGPWTPFQMFAWGFVGFSAGMLKKVINNYMGLIIYGIVSGIFFSLVMDIWTVLSFQEEASFQLYIAKVVTSLPFMALYCISNVIFLLVLAKPIGQQLKRMKIKYKVFCTDEENRKSIY